MMQPSDLYGREILPECTFESEYGKLTVSHVIVPDFSNDEKGSIRFKEEFDNIKSFIEEKDFSKKLKIAELIHENEWCAVDPSGHPIISNRAYRSSQIFSDFVCFLRANVRARMFEMGLYSNVDLCDEFGYDKLSSLSFGAILYNDIPVVQPLSCAGGVYIYCLRCIYNKNLFCLYKDLCNKILKDGMPLHNYLSWAFSRAIDDEEVISFVFNRHPNLCFGE